MSGAMNNEQHPEPPADTSRIITYEFDLDSGELVWGDGLYTLFGYERTEPANTHEWWSNHIHQEDAMALNETMDALMYPWVKEWTVDYRFVKADHTYALVHDRATVIRNEQNKPVRLRGTIWPVS
jgi:PAS domain-containing protein